MGVTMGLLIGIILFGIMAFGFFGLIFMAWAGSADDKAKQNAPDTLDRLFDGSRVDVSYTTGIGKLPFDDMVIGAKERGYDLTHQSGSPDAETLIFTRWN